jgi:hypothetical protein
MNLLVTGRPLHLCAICLPKLCWNLGVEALAYLSKLKAYCGKDGLDVEAHWYEKAIAALLGGE